MKMTLKISLAALLSVASCWSTAQQVNSMRGTDVSTIDNAPIVQPYVGSKPGQQALIVRNFKEQPPLIPHKVDGFDDITPTENSCFDCHSHTEFRGQKIPRAGKSHFLPQESASAEPVLDMKRWQCNSCHVPQIDAKPLVENVFKGNTVK
ncbi:MAG: nitrate reductase cytochrome c-type subunit [Pseudomonadota bacterium]